MIAQGAESLGLTVNEVLQLLGETTLDFYINVNAYWKNIPVNVWGYTIGGYPAIKKWLCYREERILRRSLTSEEVLEVTNMARRIVAQR